MRNYTLITLFFSLLYGTIINVPDDYPTVQEAIDQALLGDSVIISNGVYFENLMDSSRGMCIDKEKLGEKYKEADKEDV